VANEAEAKARLRVKRPVLTFGKPEGT